MNTFHHYQLSSQEEILFGPAQKIKESTLGYQSVARANSVTHEQLRTVAITNERIVIETGDACITVPNKDVVYLIIKKNKRHKTAMKSFNLVQAYSRGGRKVQLNIPGINTNKEILLSEIFPNATIQENKGLRALIDNLLK